MEQPPPLTETQPPSSGQPSMSLAARLLNVFAVPGEVFDDLKTTKPSAANWVVPTLLLLIVGCLGAYFIYSQPAIQQQMQDMQDQMIQKMVDKKMLTEEQAERSQMGNAAGMKFGPYLGAVFTAAVSPFWWGLILWVGAMILKGRIEFMKAVEVAGLSNAIAVLSSIVHTLLVVGMGNMFATAGPALLTKTDPQNPYYTLLAVVDVMTLWVLAVRAIGLARLSGTTFLRAAVWVFGVWVLYTGFIVGIGIVVRKAFGF